MNDKLETELRSAIRSQAESVHPTDRLGAIRARTQSRSAPARTYWWNRPWVLAAGTGLVAAAVVTAAVVLADPAADKPPVAGGDQREVTVYEIGEVGDRPWLFPQQVSTEATGDPAFDAVRALLNHEPTQGGRYNMLGAGACPLGGDVVSVETSPGGVIVQLAPFPPGAALCDMSRMAAAARMQQLAWTVRSAIGWEGPVRVNRGPAVVADPNALSPIIVESPADGGTVSSPVTISGSSDTFEANVVWEVESDDAGVARGGHTMGGTLGERAPFEFTVDLEPGTYTARAYAEDMETGGPFAEDTVMFTVE